MNMSGPFCGTWHIPPSSQGELWIQQSHAFPPQQLRKY